MLHGQTRYNIASSFFREIPEQLLKRIGPKLRIQSSEFKVHSAASRVSNIQHSTLSTEPSSPWRIGQNVMHPKFGVGVIVNAEGRGADARVQVNFHRNGSKWLALEYAKLSPA
jgi:DNA helicase-2/ATP-dependent DNA helicase PcrA